MSLTRFGGLAKVLSTAALLRPEECLEGFNLHLKRFQQVSQADFHARCWYGRSLGLTQTSSHLLHRLRKHHYESLLHSFNDVVFPLAFKLIEVTAIVCKFQPL